MDGSPLSDKKPASSAQREGDEGNEDGLVGNSQATTTTATTNSSAAGTTTEDDSSSSAIVGVATGIARQGEEDPTQSVASSAAALSREGDGGRGGEERESGYVYRDYSRVPPPDDDDDGEEGSAETGAATEAAPSNAAAAASASSSSSAASPTRRPLPPPAAAGPDISASPRVQKLPTKLYAILAEPSLHHIVSWLPHGRAWKVHFPKSFLEDVMPRYFEYPKYNSFIRLINAWGFRRLSDGADRGAYFHELFLRGLPHLLKQMRRLTPSEKKFELSHEEEPDLHAISRERPIPELPELPRNNAPPPTPPRPTIRSSQQLPSLHHQLPSLVAQQGQQPREELSEPVATSSALSSQQQRMVHPSQLLPPSQQLPLVAQQGAQVSRLEALSPYVPNAGAPSAVSENPAALLFAQDHALLPNVLPRAAAALLQPTQQRAQLPPVRLPGLHETAGATRALLHQPMARQGHLPPSQQLLPSVAQLQGRLLGVPEPALITNVLSQPMVRPGQALPLSQQLPLAAQQGRVSGLGGALVPPHLNDPGVNAGTRGQHPALLRSAAQNLVLRPPDDPRIVVGLQQAPTQRQVASVPPMDPTTIAVAAAQRRYLEASAVLRQSQQEEENIMRARAILRLSVLERLAQPQQIAENSSGSEAVRRDGIGLSLADQNISADGARAASRLRAAGMAASLAQPSAAASDGQLLSSTVNQAPSSFRAESALDRRHNLTDHTQQQVIPSVASSGRQQLNEEGKQEEEKEARHLEESRQGR